MKIEILKNEIIINDETFKLPFSKESFLKVLGEPSRISVLKYSTILTWDALGIYAYSKKENEIYAFDLVFQIHDDFQFFPREVFRGTFIIDGIDFRDRNVAEKENVGIHNLYNILDEEEKTIWEVSISKLEEEKKTKDYDKYKIKKSNKPTIRFQDFNFKLAVIEILMYEKELIVPKFDLYEFVELYKGRKIDIEKEGYDLIPEVTKYFEELEIEQSLAEAITEILQDGGGEIYGQICRFWDGEDDTFNIKAIEDIKYFPNLKRMSLFYDKDNDFNEKLKAKGIELI
jgi:hypothetical protein